MANRSCTTCVYAYWDPCQWMTSLSSGFPCRPICANHPDTPGRMKPVPRGDACRNYRPRPAEPDKDAKRIPLSDGLYAYVDAADYEWLSQWTWHLANGYAARTEKGKPIFMHRQITNHAKGKIVDHFNHNKLDNTRINLRVCNRQQNLRNSGQTHAAAAPGSKGSGTASSVKDGSPEIFFEGRQSGSASSTSEVEAAAPTTVPPSNTSANSPT